MRKQTKVVAVASAAALLAIGGAMTSFAAQGWVEEDGTWYYYDKDGNRVENEWKKSGDNWFWLNGDEGGAMATDMLVEWGGDGWNYTDNYMTGRTNGVATYRNSDFFGLVDGLSFALQYQGKNDHDRAIRKQNGDGFSTAATYAFDNGIALSAGYSSSNRSVDQKADGNGDKAEAWATSAKYDANNIYAAVMYSQTYNMTPEEDNHFAGKTQNFEAVVQYQFDFGLRPSIGYVQTKGKDLQSRAGFSGGDADLVKYIEVGTWYYFNKNMNVYAAYKFNQLDDNDYTKAAGVATDDQAAVGIVYQF